MWPLWEAPLVQLCACVRSCARELVPTVSSLGAEWQYSHADFTLVSFKASCLLHKCADVCFLFFCSFCCGDLNRVVTEDFKRTQTDWIWQTYRQTEFAFFFSGGSYFPRLIIVSVNSPWSNKNPRQTGLTQADTDCQIMLCHRDFVFRKAAVDVFCFFPFHVVCPHPGLYLVYLCSSHPSTTVSLLAPSLLLTK